MRWYSVSDGNGIVAEGETDIHPVMKQYATSGIVERSGSTSGIPEACHAVASSRSLMGRTKIRGRK